jgi:hypothetical protein
MVVIVEVHSIALHSARERLSFMECWQTNFSSLLHCLSVCLGLDGIQPPLLFVPSVERSRRVFSSIPVTTGFPLGNAASAEGVEAAAEEEQNPRRQGQPNGVPYFSRAYFVDAGFGKEEEGEIEYECEEGHHGCEA